MHRPAAVKNPQPNAIGERSHQTVANALRPLLLAHPPQKVQDAAFIIADTALSTAAQLARAAMHSASKISPGALMLHRDVVLDIPVIADLQSLHQQQRQALIDKNLMRANRRRISHDYQPGDEAPLLTRKPKKLKPLTLKAI
jgi:hypothetical protein